MYILNYTRDSVYANEFQVVAESLDAAIPRLLVDMVIFRFGRARSMDARGEHRVIRSRWMKASARWLESL